MGGGTGCSQVRLAELVAALSLGVDLGFGQPMEHVLRQCLIALRLADQAGLEGPDRAAVYYTALLVNVGCHADAYEQAKWFGDDIALKSGKYTHELGSFRSMLAVMRLVGSGNPPLHRFRVGLEFALTGHPALAELVCTRADEIFGDLDAVPAWQAVIAAEPALAPGLPSGQLDRALAAIANFVDLKSPFTLGHSIAVADLAGDACRRKADRRAFGDHAEDGREPRGAHLRQNRRLQPGRRRAVRGAARPAPRGKTAGSPGRPAPVTWAIDNPFT